MADDTRVVQMQFDNKNFERNIAKSQSSLEKFKASLNFDEVGKGLAKFGENVKNLAFDTLSNNIQKLTDKFTGLGNAGEYVLSRIRASLEGAALQAEQFVKSLTMEQIQVGQNKYDALTKSVQTIVAGGTATEEKAYSVMERVMEYTNQTSHNFETMVGEISTLTAQGMGLEKAERLMEGFANASTKAGADANKAAIAMSIYTKAMGAGYLGLQQFQSLQGTARVVTKEWREQIIEAAIAEGTLVKDSKGVIKTAKKFGKQVTVTVDNLESSLAKKWLTKGVLKRFGGLYEFGETLDELRHPEDAADSFGKSAYLTGQRALTFADALNAVKESISGGWMTTFRILFGDLTDAMNLWTGSCNKVIDAVSGLSEARNKFLQFWKDLGGRDSLLKLIFGEMEDTEGNTLYEGAYGIVDMFTDIGNMISEAFWDTFMNLIPKDQQEQILNEINKNLEFLGLDKPFESFEELWDSDYFKENGGRTALFGGALSGITDSIQQFVQRINDWFNEIDPTNGMTRMQKIESVLTAIGRTIAFVLEIGAGIEHFFEVLGGDEYLGPSLKAISDLLVSLGLSVVDAENDVSNADGINKFFENLAEVLQPACELINLVVGSLTELISAMVTGEKENNNFGNVLIKIGDIIKKVIGFLTNVASPIATFISDVSGILGDLFKEGFTPEAMEKAKKRFSEAFGKLWEGLKTAFQPLLEKIGAFFSMLWNEIKTRVAAYFNDPESIGHKVLEVLKKVFGPIINFLTPIWESIKGLFVGQDGKLQGPTLFDSLKALFLSEGVTNLFKKLSELAKNGGLYKLLMGALGVYSIWQIVKAVKTIGGFFTDVGGNLKAGILGSYEWFSEKIQGIAKGLLMLTAAVAILGSMDTGSVIQGVLALGFIMLEFVGFIKLMDTVNAATLTKQATLTMSITALAGALAILVLALLPFAFVSWEGFARMIGGLALVLLELIGFMELMKVLGLSTYGLGFAGIVRFAFAISILMFSLVPFMIADWQSMLRAVAGFALVLLTLTGFMELMKVLGLSTFGLNFAGIARFALAVGVLMFSLIPFMIADWQSMLRAVAGLAIVLTELLVFMELMKVLGLSTFGLDFAGIARFALAIGILMLGLIPFIVTDWQGMLRAVAGLAIVLLELIGFMELMKVLGLSTLGLNFAGLAGFSLAIGILMLSLLPFMLTDWESMLRAVAGLALVLAELIGFMTLMRTLGLSTFGLDFAGILGFALSIAVLILAIKSFAYMDWEQWARAVGGLAVILGEIIGFMALAQTLTFNAAAIGMVVAICLSIGVMALLLSMAMNEVRNLKWEVLTAFTTGMATVILAMAGAIAILSAVPLGAGIKGIVLIGLAIAALVGIIALLGPMLIDAMGNSFANLSGKLEMISGLLKGFTDRMGQVDDGNIDKASGIFDKLKTMIGKLSGWGKYNGDLENFSYSMFMLGTGMEIFNNHVGNAAGDIDSNAQAALKFIQDLSGCANDLDTISKMNMDNLIAAVAGLGGAMSIYAYGAKEIQGLLAPGETPDEQTVGQAIEILKQISTGLAEAGGFTIPSDMPDDQSLSLFGASLAALATALVQFEQAGQGLGSGTDKALEVLDFFRRLKEKLIDAEFSKNLKASIGIFDANQVSKDDLAAFGANIEQLGLAMKAFNESTTVLDEASGERKAIDFSNAISTLDSLVELQGKLGWDFGPLIKFFAGRKKDFTDLGGEIEALGTALADFNTKLGGVDEKGNPKLDPALFEDAIAIADQVATYLNTLKEKMSPVGGVFVEVSDFFDGKDFSFTNLKTQLEALAEGLGSLGTLKVEDKLLTIDDTQGIFKMLDGVIAYLNQLKTDQESVGGVVNDVSDFFDGYDFDFKALKGQLTALGEGLSGLSVFDPKNLPTKEEMEAAFPMINSLLDYLNLLKGKMEPVGGVANDVSDFFDGYDFDFKALKGQLTALGDGLNSISQVTVDSEGKSLFNEEGRGAALDTMDALIEYMQTLTGKLGRIGGIAQFFNDLWNGKEADFQYLGTQLGFLGDGLGKFQAGITAHGEFDAAKVSTALGALDHLVSMMQTFSVLSQSMDAISQSYGLSNYTTQNLMQNMVNALFQMTDVHELEGHAGSASVVGQLANFIKEFDYQLSELGGLENVDAIDILNGVATAISTLVTAAKDMQNDQGQIAVDFSVIGTQICNGVIAGIEAGQSGVITAAVNMAVAAYEAAKGALDINSPSRIFADLGMSVGEGFVKGMDNQEEAVEGASEDLSKGAVDSATNAMAAFAALMSQEIDANPTITPVLDLSNITAGSDAINRMLSGEKDLSLAGAGADYSKESIPRNDSGTSEYRGQDLTWINQAIEGLGSQISTMANQISNMQIVLDTGVLVGGVTDGVNRNLGAKTTYGRRRN